APMIRVDRPAGTVPPVDLQCAAARSNKHCTARAVSGVRSEGFQTQELPQTRASAAFQDQTATGKLKAEIMPMTPRGGQVSIMRCPGRPLEMVNPCSCRDSPTAKSQMSIIS